MVPHPTHTNAIQIATTVALFPTKEGNNNEFRCFTADGDTVLHQDAKRSTDIKPPHTVTLVAKVWVGSHDDGQGGITTNCLQTQCENIALTNHMDIGLCDQLQAPTITEALDTAHRKQTTPKDMAITPQKSTQPINATEDGHPHP